MPSPATTALDRLPMTPLHWALVVTCAFGLLFDVVEAGLSNALSAVFSAPPHHVQPQELSLLLASVFIGGAVGAPVLGWLADRYGRRQALATSLLVLTVTSLVAATSTSIGWLTFFRVLSGIALGSYPPLMVAYLSDVLPPSSRGRAILLGGAIGFLGAPLVIFLIRWLTPLQPLGYDGWRWTLVIGAIGSLVVAILLRFMPESPRWLASQGRMAEADAAYERFRRSAGLTVAPDAPSTEAQASKEKPARRALWSELTRELKRLALMFGLLDFLMPWATIGFPLLSGAALVAKGFHVSDSLLYVGLTMFGPTLGVLIGSQLIDRMERRTALMLCGTSMAVAAIAFALTDQPWLLITTGALFNLIGAIYISTVTVYSAEVFPTRLRALVSSSTWAVNRVAAALVPLAMLPLMKSHGVLAMFSVIAAALLLSAALVGAFGPRGVTRKPVAA